MRDIVPGEIIITSSLSYLHNRQMNVKNFTLSDTIQEKPEEVSLHSGLAAHTADQRSCARSLVGLWQGPEQQSWRSVRSTVASDAMTAAIKHQKGCNSTILLHNASCAKGSVSWCPDPGAIDDGQWHDADDNRSSKERPARLQQHGFASQRIVR